MRIAGLYVYPVKGCRALAVEEAALDALGLANDRRFAFIAEDGTAVTQRDQPLLASVRPALDEQSLSLDFGGLFEIVVGLRDFSEPTAVDVWGHRVPGRTAPASLLAPAAEYLGTKPRLVALERGVLRSFRDARPVLVTTSAMLAALNEQLATPVGMERFRPNVVLHGGGDWTSLQGKDVLLERDELCGRCEVTTIDQASGERRGPEPLRTLSERFDGNFGVYCRVSRPGHLRRGEELKAS